jgi:hypothetical protein
MDLIQNLSTGFGVAFTFQNLIYCFVGCLLGTLIGVLPGMALWRPSPCCCPPLTRCPRGGADHAGRYLLRRPVRWLHHRHFGEPAR